MKGSETGESVVFATGFSGSFSQDGTAGGHVIEDFGFEEGFAAFGEVVGGDVFGGTFVFQAFELGF